MTNTERNQRLLEAMRRQTAERLADPVKLREWIRKVHGPEMRELEDKEAEQMLIVLKLVESYNSTNNQRTSTDFYRHSGKEYRVTYGLGDDPLIEEILDDE